MGSASGDLMQFKGININDNFSEDPGKFMFKYNKIVGPYWIVAIGKRIKLFIQIHLNDNFCIGVLFCSMLGSPTSGTGSLYPWTVFSDPLAVNVFILARDVDTFQSQYETQVLKLVADLGFKLPTNKPIKTFQSKTACTYAPEPTV